MNNGLTESENSLNCILENYINELQRNACDDDEEDMRIYQEKIDYITSLKEIVLKDLEVLEAIKNKAQNNRFFKGCLLRMFCETKKTPNGMNKEKIKDENYDKIVRWLDGKD